VTKGGNGQPSINLLGSPIKTLIPMLNCKPNAHMTPQTQMLYAYSESPLLRGDSQQL